MRREATAFIPCLVLVVAACGGSPPATPPGAAVGDVDGVRVVDNTTPEWRQDRRWTISADPVLTLGVDVGPPAQMFSGYVHPPFALADGRIVVPDRSGEIRYFDASGAYLASAGRSGQGPCEFGNMGPAYPARDDSIAVWDSRLRRVAIFGAGATCLDTVSLEPHGEDYGRPQVVGRFADGTLLARAFDSFPRGVPGTRVTRTGAFFRYGLDGSTPRLLLEIPISEAVIGSEWPVVFAATPLVAARGDHVYYAAGDNTEVSTYDLDGNPVQRFSRRHEPRSVTQADRDAWLEMSRRNVDAAQADREFAERMLSMAAFHDYMPEVRALLVDELGNTWAERHLGLAHTRPIMIGNGSETFAVESSRWDVFDSDGRWLGTVDLVAGREPTYIGSDYILMRGADEAGVAKVWKYTLIKPS